jgi:hypothetical protein
LDGARAFFAPAADPLPPDVFFLGSGAAFPPAFFPGAAGFCARLVFFGVDEEPDDTGFVFFLAFITTFPPNSVFLDFIFL